MIECKNTRVFYKADDGRVFTDETSCREYEYLKEKYSNTEQIVSLNSDTYYIYKAKTSEELEELVLKWLGYEYGSHYAFERLWKMKIKNNLSNYVNKYIYFTYDEGDYSWANCYLVESLISELKEDIKNIQESLGLLENLEDQK